MQDFFQIISNFGFPVAVASYLLFRFEKKLEELERVNGELVDKVIGLQSLQIDNKKLIGEVEKLNVELKRLSKTINNKEKR